MLEKEATDNERQFARDVKVNSMGQSINIGEPRKSYKDVDLDASLKYKTTNIIGIKRAKSTRYSLREATKIKNKYKSRPKWQWERKRNGLNHY